MSVSIFSSSLMVLADLSPQTPGDLMAFLRLDILGRLIIAAALGGAVGLERELRGKAAGFRTNMLICVGSALLTELSYAFAATTTLSSVDPTRMSSAIIQGLGFVAAGVIIQGRGGVVGITTAATLWVVAAIGIAVGIGQYMVAAGTTIFVLMCLIGLGKFESRMRERTYQQVIRLRVANRPNVMAWIKELMASHRLEGSLLRGDHGLQEGKQILTVTYRCRTGENHLRAAVEKIMEEPGVIGVALD